MELSKNELAIMINALMNEVIETDKRIKQRKNFAGWNIPNIGYIAANKYILEIDKIVKKLLNEASKE